MTHRQRRPRLLEQAPMIPVRRERIDRYGLTVRLVRAPVARTTLRTQRITAIARAQRCDRTPLLPHKAGSSASEAPREHLGP